MLQYGASRAVLKTSKDCPFMAYFTAKFEFLTQWALSLPHLFSPAFRYTDVPPGSHVTSKRFPGIIFSPYPPPPPYLALTESKSDSASAQGRQNIPPTPWDSSLNCEGGQDGKCHPSP